MGKPKIRCTQDNMHLLLARMEKNIAKRTDELAQQGDQLLSQDIRRGTRHGGTRKVWNRVFGGFGTGASESSIYHVKTDGSSTYAETVSSFKSKAGENYSGKELDDLIFPEYKPHRISGRYVSSFSSLSLVVAFWEYGHHNKFTGRYESVPILSWTAFVMAQRMKNHYRDIMHETP